MSLRERLIAAGLSGALLLAGLMAGQSEGEVRKVYRDPISIPTVCFGHTGKDLVENHEYTKQECTNLLVGDLAEALAVVDRCTPGLPEGPRAALTDFALNVGPGKVGVKDGLCVLKDGRMPTIRRRALAGDIPGTCRALNEGGSWSSAGGKKLAGLVTRRAMERDVCEGRKAL